MTWPTSSGWASEAAAPTMLSAATATRTFLCSKRKGRSWRNVARGPSCCAPRPRRRVACVLDMRNLVLEMCTSTVLSRGRGFFVRAVCASAAAEAAVRGLLGHPESARDRLPGVAEVARPAHLGLLGAGDVLTQAREPMQFGQRLTALLADGGGC